MLNIYRIAFFIFLTMAGLPMVGMNTAEKDQKQTFETAQNNDDALIRQAFTELSQALYSAKCTQNLELRDLASKNIMAKYHNYKMRLGNNFKKFIDFEDKDGMNIILFAAWAGHFELIDALIHDGANVNYINQQAGTAALQAGVNSGNFKVVEKLCMHNADVDPKALQGIIFYAAITKEQLDSMKCIFRHFPLKKLCFLKQYTFSKIAFDFYYNEESPHNLTQNQIEIIDYLLEWESKVALSDELQEIHNIVQEKFKPFKHLAFRVQVAECTTSIAAKKSVALMLAKIENEKEKDSFTQAFRAQLNYRENSEETRKALKEVEALLPFSSQAEKSSEIKANAEKSSGKPPLSISAKLTAKDKKVQNHFSFEQTFTPEQEQKLMSEFDPVIIAQNQKKEADEKALFNARQQEIEQEIQRLNAQARAQKAIDKAKKLKPKNKVPKNKKNIQTPDSTPFVVQKRTESKSKAEQNDEYRLGLEVVQENMQAVLARQELRKQAIREREHYLQKKGIEAFKKRIALKSEPTLEAPLAYFYRLQDQYAQRSSLDAAALQALRNEYLALNQKLKQEGYKGIERKASFENYYQLGKLLKTVNKMEGK